MAAEPVRLGRGGPSRYFFFAFVAFLAAGFEVFLALVEADFARVPDDFDAPLRAPDFAALLRAPDFPALFLAEDFAAPFLPPDFAALFLAPDFAALFLPDDFEAPFEADFAADLVPPRAPPFDALPPDLDLDPEVFPPVLLLAFVVVEEVLESPMALPAASFILVMAD
ncbi:MAG TPA: hypothetical protein VF601_03185 [Beijerinckiaceae bacterium]|jgi:hypothetical protein